MKRLLQLSFPIPLRGRLLLAAVLVSLVALVLNPWVVGTDMLSDPVGDGVLIVQGVLGIAWLATVSVLRLRQPGDNHDAKAGDVPARPLPPSVRGRVAGLLLVIFVLWLTMFRARWSRPTLATDDYHYLAIAETWQSTRQNLLTPYNEHLCVPTRLLTWALCALVPRDGLAHALAFAGLALFAATFVPLFEFVRREWGAPALGLAAVSLFALTGVHREVVTWYSASQWCWALLALLAALLILQRGRVLRSSQVAAGTLLATAAPFSYAVGVLVGPLASIYAALRSWANSTQREPRPHLSTRALGCVLPAIASVCALVAIALWKGPEIARRANYGGQPPARAIAPLQAILFGVRTTVDVLVLRNLGVEQQHRLPRVVYAAAFPVLVFLVGELIRRSTCPRVPLLGVALVLLSYAMTLPFRAWVQYEDFLNWSRYQLFPQLGVVLMVCSALAEFGPDWIRTPEISCRHAAVASGLAVLQFWMHAVF